MGDCRVGVTELVIGRVKAGSPGLPELLGEPSPGHNTGHPTVITILQSTKFLTTNPLTNTWTYLYFSTGNAVRYDRILINSR